MTELEKMLKDAYIIEVESAFCLDVSELDEEKLTCKFKVDNTMKYVRVMERFSEDGSFALYCSPDKDNWKLCFGAVIDGKPISRVSEFIKMTAERYEKIEDYLQKMGEK